MSVRAWVLVGVASTLMGLGIVGGVVMAARTPPSDAAGSPTIQAANLPPVTWWWYSEAQNSCQTLQNTLVSRILIQAGNQPVTTPKAFVGAYREFLKSQVGVDGWLKNAKVASAMALGLQVSVPGHVQVAYLPAGAPDPVWGVTRTTPLVMFYFFDRHDSCEKLIAQQPQPD